MLLKEEEASFGSHLRTKLVIAFFFFAVAPTALLFLVSTKFLATSFETWFSGRAATVMMKTRETGAIMYERDRKRVENLAELARTKIKVKSSSPFFRGIFLQVSIQRV